LRLSLSPPLSASGGRGSKFCQQGLPSRVSKEYATSYSRRASSSSDTLHAL
jgi:hypothetical protein